MLIAFMETSNSALKGHSLYFEEWLWKLLHDLIFNSKSYITWNFKCNFYLMKFNQTLNRKKGEQVFKKKKEKKKCNLKNKFSSPKKKINQLRVMKQAFALQCYRSTKANNRTLNTCSVLKLS